MPSTPAPFSCVPHTPEAQGSLPGAGRHCSTYITHISLGRAVRYRVPWHPQVENSTIDDMHIDTPCECLEGWTNPLDSKRAEVGCSKRGWCPIKKANCATAQAAAPYPSRKGLAV